MRKPDGFAPGSLLRVNPGRKPEWPATELGYGEFSELVRTARKLITGARAIDADDLNLPERSTGFSVDVAELEKRAAAAEQSLRRTPNDFQTLLATPDTANLDVLRELIMRSAGFGVAGAVPLSAAGNSPADRQTLLAQAGSIQKELAQRVEQLTALAAGFNADTATLEDRRDHATGAAARRLRQGVCRAAAFHGGERRGAGESAGRQRKGAGRRSARFDHLVPTNGARARGRRLGSCRAQLCRSSQAPAKSST